MQRPEIFTRDVGLEKNDSLGKMHNSDQLGIKISGFTPSYEALGKMMTKVRISHMSDFSCGETKVHIDP